MLRADRVKLIEPHTIPHTRLPNAREDAEREIERERQGREAETEKTEREGGRGQSSQCMLVLKGDGGVCVQVDERHSTCWYALHTCSATATPREKKHAPSMSSFPF